MEWNERSQREGWVEGGWTDWKEGPGGEMSWCKVSYGGAGIFRSIIDQDTDVLVLVRRICCATGNKSEGSEGR